METAPKGSFPTAELHAKGSRATLPVRSIEPAVPNSSHDSQGAAPTIGFAPGLPVLSKLGASFLGRTGSPLHRGDGCGPMETVTPGRAALQGLRVLARSLAVTGLT